MPGIFGTVRVEGAVQHRLQQEWKAVWPECSIAGFGAGSCLGGHTFRESHAIFELAGAGWICVDGDASVPSSDAFGAGVMRRANGVLVMNNDYRMNVACISGSGSRVELITERTGSFPLYFAQHRDGFLFSSLLRPIARALSASPDPIGLVQFLRNGYTFAGRTPFTGIRRLQPGQRITYALGRCEIEETSRLWAEPSVDASTPSEVAEEAIPLLRSSLEKSMQESGRTVLMLSAGWDSRTLLSFISRDFEGGEVLAYSHGDGDSRELGLARRLCLATDTPHHLSEITGDAFQAPWIEGMFPTVECAVFPHWIKTGEVLQGLGVRQMVAGVYGEIMGGHYGETMIRRGAGKIPAFLGSLVSGRPSASPDPPRWPDVRALFSLESLSCPWYLRREYFMDHPYIRERRNEDVCRDIERLRRRGVTSTSRAVEAFISEHRGSQYINAQPLSCKGSVLPALPFLDGTLLDLMTRTPLSVRLHNRVSRSIIQQVNPTLLRFPMGATLVAASAPLLIQECSRVIRKVYGKWRWRLHARSEGRTPHAHLSWSNFEFLRSGRELEAIVDRLEASHWDRQRMLTVLKTLHNWEWKTPVQPLANQLGKIHTIDLLMK